MKKYITTVLGCITMLAISLSACNKLLTSTDIVPLQNITALGMVSGGVYFQDIHLNNGQKTPMIGQAVVLTYTSDKNLGNILQTVQTDANGNFKFFGLIKDTSYTIYAVSGGTIYSYTGLPSSDSIDFKPDSAYYSLKIAFDSNKINGLYITTQDTSGGNIPHASVVLYSSRILASIDSTVSGVGRLLQTVTDSTGTALLLQLPVLDSIFVRALYKPSDTDAFSFKSPIISIKIGKTGVVDTMIKLK